MGFATVLVVLSPKFHVNAYGVVPPLTVEVKATDRPVVGDAGVNEKLANKGAVVMVSVVVAEPGPALFVAVTLMVKLPAEAYR